MESRDGADNALHDLDKPWMVAVSLKGALSHSHGQDLQYVHEILRGLSNDAVVVARHCYSLKVDIEMKPPQGGDGDDATIV